MTGFRKVPPVLQQMMVKINLYRADAGTGSAQSGGIGKMLKFFTLQPWHQNTANGSGVRRAIRMSANMAEYRTDIQAGAATYAVQYFSLFFAGQKPASPVVDQNHMKLFRTIG